MYVSNVQESKVGVRIEIVILPTTTDSLGGGGGGEEEEMQREYNIDIRVAATQVEGDNSMYVIHIKHTWFSTCTCNTKRMHTRLSEAIIRWIKKLIISKQ